MVRIKSGLFKDELGAKAIKELYALRPKTWSYLKDDGSENKKAKGTKKIVIKRRLMHKNYKRKQNKSLKCQKRNFKCNVMNVRANCLQKKKKNVNFFLKM